MRKFIATLLLLPLLTSVYADTKGEAAIEALSQKVRSMKSGYDVSFVIFAEGIEQRGTYSVRDNRFYIKSGDSEVFSDGRIRYEVNAAKHEIVIDRVDIKSRNILTNPTRAFDFLTKDYNCRFVSRTPTGAIVAVSPKHEVGSDINTIKVTLDAKTSLPKRFIYEYEGNQLEVRFMSITPSSTAIKQFVKSRYPKYTIIDFR